MDQPVGTVRRWAPAKVNLSLSVGAADDSGYHEVETVYAKIDLADEIEVAPARSGTLELSVDGDAGGVTPEENLVYRAASRFFQDAPTAGAWVAPRGFGGASISLSKRIPAGGGLGGGSSDAATALLALNDIYGTPLGARGLLAIARELGADISFFLTPWTVALGRGRGDELSPLTPPPAAPVVLALPPIHVSTAEAYRRLDHARGDAAPERPVRLDLDGALDWELIAGQSRNDFEPVVHDWHPELGELFQAFGATGPLLARMSGSGAAHFGVYDSEESADRAQAVLAVAFPEVRFERTQTRGPS